MQHQDLTNILNDEQNKFGKVKNAFDLLNEADLDPCEEIPHVKPPAEPLPDGDDPQTMFDYLERPGNKNLSKTQLTAYVQRQKLTPLQRDVIVGTLLGDATIPTVNAKPGKFLKFDQRIRSYSYIHHLYDIFEPLVGTGPKVRKPKNSSNYSIWFRTCNHPSIYHYSQLFYNYEYSPNIAQPVRRKVVPKTIKKYLTPRAIAYWFMDDGSYNDNRNKRDYTLNTQGFREYEVLRLINALYERHKISSYKIPAETSEKGQFIICISASKGNACRFRKLIEEYVLEAFRYKL